MVSLVFKVGDGSLSHNLAINLEDEIQDILAELRESGDYFRDEDFDVTDRESMEEIFEPFNYPDKKGILRVFKKTGRSSKINNKFIKKNSNYNWFS